MPDVANPEAGAKKDDTKSDDAAQNAGDAGSSPAKTAGDGTEAKTNSEKTFTQDELNRILARETGKLDADAKAWRDYQASKQTEEEKAKQERDQAKQEAEVATQRANRRLIQADIRLEAAAAGVRPEAISLVVKALSDDESIAVDDKTDEVKGVKKAVEAFVKDNEYLKSTASTPGKSGGEFGGQVNKTLDDQIAEAEAKGDWRLSRRLKLQKLTNATAT